MTPQLWEKAKSIFGAAIEMDAGQRETFARQACGSDEPLLREVLALLQADTTETLLRGPFGARSGLPVLGGRYRLVRELGRGGLGVAMLAHDETLHDRPVVVKMPLDPTPQDPWLAAKFAEEVKALSRIDHPGVVGALDSGIAPDGRPYLVIQYVNGRPLSAALQAEGVPLEFAAAVLEQIGQALGAAHGKGIWHRDLKPANIMLQRLDDGREHVLLIDFGIATVQDVPATEVETRVAGTLSYMAPEQMQGRVSAASDIFAMGIVAFELITGRRPFIAQHILQLAELHKAGTPLAPSELRPGLPPTAEKRILQALAYRPEDRPRSAAEFGVELARALRHPAAQPAPPSRRTALIACAGGVAALGGASAWWFGKGPADRLEWTLMAQSGSHRPAAAVAPGDALHTGDEFFLMVRATRGGYLYLFSDDPAKDTLNALGSFQLRNGEQNRIPEGRGFIFDEPGVLNLWCAWSRETLAALETPGRLLNERDRGVVADRAERAKIRGTLSGLPHPKPEPARHLAGDSSMAWTIRVEAQ